MFLRSAIQFYSKPSWMHRSYSSGNTEFNIFSEVINILAKKKPIEPALEPLVPFLSKKIITSVIKDQVNRRLGFRFFIWASRRERLRSRDSFSLVIDMLSEENGCDLYWQTLEELKSGGEEAEATALLWALQSTWGLGFRLVEFDGDNNNLIHLVNSNTTNLRLQHYLREINLWRSQFDMINFSYHPRAQNLCADLLARTCISYAQPWALYDYCPSFLASLVNDDYNFAH